MQQLISEYGYLAVLVGTFFEGETVVVLGALAAKLGYLDIGFVILAALAGTFCGDQLYFFIGRHYGDRLLARWPSWRMRAESVNELMLRYDTWFILGFRFIYGMRSISPFVIGMSRIRTGRFMLLNFLAAVLWASAVGGASFALGSAIDAFLLHLKRVEGFVLGAVVVAGLSIWVTHLVRTRISARRYVERESGKPAGIKPAKLR